MARIVVHQVGFPHSEALEQFALKKLDALLRREQAGDRLWAIEVFFKIASRVPAGTANQYTARIAIKVPWRQQRMVTTGEAARAQPALTMALEKMQKRLRRDSKKNESGRRTIGHTQRSARALKRSQT